MLARRLGDKIFVTYQHDGNIPVTIREEALIGLTHLAKFEAKSRIETSRTRGTASLKRKILTKKLAKPLRLEAG